MTNFDWKFFPNKTDFKDWICALAEQLWTIKTSQRSQINPKNVSTYCILSSTTMSIQTLPFFTILHSQLNYHVYKRNFVSPVSGLCQIGSRGGGGGTALCLKSGQVDSQAWLSNQLAQGAKGEKTPQSELS